ncbi:MAG: hypothetical protein RJA21_1899 [Gemmatimonadota bacterium]
MGGLVLVCNGDHAIRLALMDAFAMPTLPAVLGLVAWAPDVTHGGTPVVWRDPAVLDRTAQSEKLPALDHARVHGDADQLAVGDEGSAFPRTLQAKVFEPFFTAKAPGQGTRFGLAVCDGIVNDHGGQLELVSPQGAGAVFRVSLPIGIAP